MASGAVAADSGGHVCRELAVGAPPAGAPAGAGALVAAAVVDGVVAKVYCLHCHILFPGSG
ncbi:hypothetical protein C2W62_10980 [Candidatus Entotheonella serta]|nr:hypothetical protein C2W62_10980 [Candidatus Entotheonella serta]